MKKFQVCIPVLNYRYVNVEAKNHDEARHKALDKIEAEGDSWYNQETMSCDEIKPKPEADE
jgi:hypothetical protein